MSYEYIQKGQKLHFNCKGCKNKIELDIEKAKLNNPLEVICKHCGFSNLIDTNQFFKDIDKLIKQWLKTQ